MPLARGTALTALSGLMLTTGAVPAGAVPAPEPDWRLCSEVAAGWDEDDERTLCGTVAVPLDHDDPDGRTIEIAVTRIPAAEDNTYPVLFNPGGPGHQGVTMPGRILDSEARDLGLRHDLIGFDPRGIGHSAALECDDDYVAPDPSPDLSAEQRARALAEEHARINAECHANDPELVDSLTVENVARDMELVRQALGAETIGYYGVSWGSLLGVTYRSLFDDRVEAMLLDSVVSPDTSVSRLEEGQAEAGEEVFHRFTDWVAEHDDVYGLGTEGGPVRTRVLDLRDELAEEPRTAPDGTVVDGDAVTALLSTPEREWPDNAAALVTLLDGGVPELGQPHSEGFGWDTETDGGTFFAQMALLCNDSESPRDFDQVWQNRTERAERLPAMGTLGFYEHLCVGWPSAGLAPELSRGESPLQLVGHTREMVTPHRWALDMSEVVGGRVLSVEDDGHGTLSDLPCAETAVEFFETREAVTDTCPGTTPPTPRG
ncbi:alpha/beta fold hydrolase [Nocardiopsis sp. L17-MgMaSL7]|uniref:alpha/beta fold hydrolase n=1 Tax=Nocardiopsis sp. L17-MgMaSL7 TaxID=1938893 RepID=UPI000D71BB84|nr:alpha/beta fold hydrolase [Nocardiopsis sp. L17-MgMaSL7]PWV55293.1 alpha/beta hydrolase family protein [Nocardiopsis sp. L17-MgMaSL7]